MLLMTDLAQVKRQCRVDFDDDDELLTGLAEAAEAEVIRWTGRTAEELLDMGAGGIPAPLRQAVLIRVAQFYAQPEGTDKPNALYESLIRPYQKI